MRLGTKVLLILSGVWVAISLTTLAYSKYSLTNDYAQLEQRNVLTDIERTRNTLNAMQSSLRAFTNDWSQWNDAYKFMQNKNQAFVQSNLATSTFMNANLNIILFFGKTGNLFHGMIYSSNENRFIPIPADFINALAAEKSFLVHNSISSVKTGIFKTPEGYAMLCSLPILTSKGEGPIAGTIVMGYFITDQDITKLSSILNMQVHLFKLPIPTNNELLNKAETALKNGKGYYITALDKNTIAGFTFLYDIDHVPIGILQIQEPRLLYNEGVITINHYLLIIVGIGLIFLGLIWYLLKIFVLDRMVSVSDQVISIKSECKFTRRIDNSGDDELGQMVFAINSLMDIIELTENQLKYRINLRAQELQRLSKLNKNLCDEMVHQKEVEEELREGEKALQQMAYYDALTGLPNRYYFNEILQKILDQAKNDHNKFAIMFVDADKFKSINDTHGHEVGDIFLKHSAQQLQRSLHQTDIIARIGGDEFIICVNNIKDKTMVNTIAKRLLKNLSMPLLVGGLSISSTFSIGVCIYPQDGDSANDLERLADLAMYYAKRKNGNTFCYHDELMRESMV